MFDLNRRPILWTIGRRFRLNLYILVSHTNRQPIKNTIGVVTNRLVGMGLKFSIFCPVGIQLGGAEQRVPIPRQLPHEEIQPGRRLRCRPEMHRVHRGMSAFSSSLLHLCLAYLIGFEYMYIVNTPKILFIELALVHVPVSRSYVHYLQLC